MNKELVMSQDNLEDIVVRIFGCKAVLEAIKKAMPEDVLYTEALNGAIDLLEHIGKDFEADISCAELCAEKGR